MKAYICVYTKERIMKKVLLSVFATIIASMGFAQSLQLIDPELNADVTGDTIFMSVDKAGLDTMFIPPTIKVYVKNVNSSDLSVYLKRYELDPIVDSTSNYFCWGATCLGDDKTGNQPIRFGEPTDTTIVPAGDTNKTLASYYEPNNYYTGTPFNKVYMYGKMGFRYVVFDRNNPNDSASVILMYNIQEVVGVDEISKVDYDLSVGPNPAIDQLNVNYKLNNNYAQQFLEVYDLLGNLVKISSLNGPSGRLELNVSDLNAGIYFYRLRLDGVQTASQKLVIAH